MQNVQRFMYMNDWLYGINYDSMQLESVIYKNYIKFYTHTYYILTGKNEAHIHVWHSKCFSSQFQKNKKYVAKPLEWYSGKWLRGYFQQLLELNGNEKFWLYSFILQIKKSVQEKCSTQYGLINPVFLSTGIGLLLCSGLGQSRRHETGFKPWLCHLLIAWPWITYVKFSSSMKWEQ